MQDPSGYYPTNVAAQPEFAPGRNPYGSLKNVIVDWNLVNRSVPMQCHCTHVMHHVFV